MGWLVRNLLPKYLVDEGFSLSEDEDFIILSHEGEGIGHYTSRVFMWRLVRDALDHLRDQHGISYEVGPDRNGLIRRYRYQLVDGVRVQTIAAR